MEIKNNQLYLAGVKAEDLVKKYGSPLYVYETDLIAERYQQFVENIKWQDKKVYYAIKANANPEILRLIRKLGAGIETVSLEEIEAGLEAGFKPDQIIFTCSSLSTDDLKKVISQGITINIDSLSQLEKFGTLKPGGKTSLRLNLQIGAGHHEHVITGGPKSKFGIYYTQIDEAKEIAQKHGLKINGLHQHIGSHVLEPDIFMQAMTALLERAREFPDLEFLDFGGGFGVPYEPEDKPLNLKQLGKKIDKTFKQFCQSYGRPLQMVFEPGRFLVAESGTLLCTVTDVKRTGTKTFVGLDSGFNHLLRPAMYNSYHQIVNASKVRGKQEEVTVVGNVCESGDMFAKDRSITYADEGEVFAILNTGAYGFTMSSNYNLRKKPLEIMVSKGKSKIIKSVVV